ncbi:Undecaprenyl phosphate-alpha-4-amino-4-deoxy-L-arabinose arabinosyl transferase [Marinomonas spartinae]|nr:Undecaprenyl phosphate-alpha-4-amino-4-deoxy-L-arabinose arabinosyl transferase [Marinomonas spartinae]
MPHPYNKLPSIKGLLFLLIGSVVVRFLSLSMYPILDSTEARYAEVARFMAATHNWVIPMLSPHMPYMGNPPMFAWMSAIGFSLFGMNSVAARLPHLIAGIGTLVLVYYFAKHYFKSANMGCIASAILATTSVFLILIGAVSPETSMTFGITLTMVSFWFAWNNKNTLWGYGFFIGLAISLLSKGPIALLLICLSLTFWLLSNGRWLHLKKRLPWGYGSLLFLLLTLPWIVLAEHRMPGVLHYYISSEYIQWFFLGNSQGEFYASIHHHVRGMIWFFALIAMLPWTPLLIIQWVRILKKGGDTEGSSDGVGSYLLLWLFTPLVLYTFTGNILISFVMPSLPAMAMLIAYYQANYPLPKWVYSLGIATPVFLMMLVGGIHFHLTKNYSQMAIISDWKLQAETKTADLFYLHKRPFSALFYSSGKAEARSGDRSKWLSSQTKPFFIIQKSKYSTHYPNWSCEERAEEADEKLIYCKPSPTKVAADTLTNKKDALTEKPQSEDKALENITQ